MSKGHASLGLYAILDHFNLLEEDISNFCKYDSKIGGHPNSKNKSIECSTGSLGHGFPFALGLAMSKKIKKESGNIFVIIGDGEANEGTIWETALLAAHHNIDNLYCILDQNHSSDRALNVGNVVDKFEAFGWDCDTINGHNQHEIKYILSETAHHKPKFILANTIKGNGCKILENNPEWHHKQPKDDTELNLLLESVYQYEF